MAKTAAEIRREKLRQRSKQAVKTRDQKGLGRKSVIDWGRYDGVKPKSYTLRHGKDENDINVIDFLPWKVTQEWYKNLRTKAGLTTNLDVGDWDYKFEVPVHWNVGENNDILICNRLAFGQKCPDCEQLSLEYEKDKGKRDEQKIRGLSPSWRDFYNIYDYNENSNPDDDEVMILENVAFGNMEEAILAAADEGEETILYSDIEIGRTVRLTGKEEFYNKNPYAKIINEDYVEFVDRQPYGEDIVDKTVSFDALVNLVTYEEFKAIRDGIDQEPRGGKESRSSDDKSASTETSGRRGGGRRGGTTETKSEAKAWKPGDGCPSGMTFGDPDVDVEQCKTCADEVFKACADEQDKLKAQAEKKQTKEPEQSAPATTGRRRRRS